MIEQVRTIKIQIKVPLDVAYRTIQEWLAACNHISKIAFENNCLSNSIHLHKLVYYEARALFKLSSQFTCNAIRHVASRYASAKSQGQTIKKPFRFTKQALVMQYKYDFKYQARVMDIWTIDGRMKGVEYQAGTLFEHYANWEIGGATLYIQHGKVYLGQSINKEIPQENSSGKVIGVDRGLHNLATATDGQRAAFFGGRRVKQHRRHHEKLRASLQRKKAQHSTRSLERLLKRLSGRMKRYMANVNHVVSKEVVQFAVESNASRIVTEDLRTLPQRADKEFSRALRKVIHEWAYADLQKKIAYKAQMYGIELKEVDSRGTSKTCSKCGYNHKQNRKKHVFKCLQCNYQLDSDLNAARIIRQRGILLR